MVASGLQDKLVTKLMLLLTMLDDVGGVLRIVLWIWWTLQGYPWVPVGISWSPLVSVGTDLCHPHAIRKSREFATQLELN